MESWAIALYMMGRVNSAVVPLSRAFQGLVVAEHLEEAAWIGYERGVITSEPGLYSLGLYFQYSLSSPLVGGVGRDAEYEMSHLMATSKEGKKSSAEARLAD